MLDKTNNDSLHEVRISERMTLRYRQAGTGAPLVLIHTIRTQLEYFDKIVPILAPHFTVYAIDLPGHGHSAIDTRAAYDEPYLRDAVVAFIKALDLKDVTLAGESIGGVLALTAASALPDRVKAVVASNPYDYDQRYGDGVRRGNLFANVAIGSYAIPLIGAINAALENRLFLRWVMNGGLDDNRNLPRALLIELDRAGRRKGYRHVERSTFANWRSWRKARARYGDVKAPVTIIYGDHDWSRSHERQRNACDMPTARMMTLQQTGHFAALERPREIADVIIGSGRGVAAPAY